MKYTVYVMAAIGAIFWVAALVIPGSNAWMIVASAVLIAWCWYWLMSDPAQDSILNRVFKDDDDVD